MKSFFETGFLKSKETVERILQDPALLGSLVEVTQTCIQALEAGGKILFAGNGGSAADAQHLAAELVCRYKVDRQGLPALALTVDTSALTAIGNDYGYDSLFSRQLEALGRKGDVLFAISTSGNSKNILTLIERAKEMGVYVIGLTGATGGRMKEMCDTLLCMPSHETSKIQESHMMSGHLICEQIEHHFFQKEAVAQKAS